MQPNLNLLGLHSLLTLKTKSINKLQTKDEFVKFMNFLLEELFLEKVGDVSHVFENESFTVAFCLKESHICIHTWPEIETLTADIYLCNYSSDNTFKVKKISEELINYFEATILKKIEVER
jgi:S-adenosylmethionine decarboxylase